jgi:dTDP-glucose 4,6-dehydratase
MLDGKSILITGGCGFIGTNLIKFLIKKYPEYDFYNLDSLTYSGNQANLAEEEKKSNYNFIKGDITNSKFVMDLFFEHKFDKVIHLAAESHVDRSISNPLLFANTNIIGTINLLEASKKIWKGAYENKLFYHVSTDEVFGALGRSGFFKEESKYNPSSPYSASKASSDHFVNAYFKTYDLPTVISNCSNNYGPYQYPEKLIPLFIKNILNQKKLPIYGNGLQIRDWLYVEDHCKAIDTILHNPKLGEAYLIGGLNEMTNISLVKKLCSLIDRKQKNESKSELLIEYIDDRLGHDFRYAIDSTKLQNELDWKPQFDLNEGLSKTVQWYMDNKDWLYEK